MCGAVTTLCRDPCAMAEAVQRAESQVRLFSPKTAGAMAALRRWGKHAPVPAGCVLGRARAALSPSPQSCPEICNRITHRMGSLPSSNEWEVSQLIPAPWQGSAGSLSSGPRPPAQTSRCVCRTITARSAPAWVVPAFLITGTGLQASFSSPPRQVNATVLPGQKEAKRQRKA